MREIYSRSKNVYIWLGESKPEDEVAVNFAKFLEKASATDRTPDKKQHVWAFPNDNVPRLTDERWNQFFALFNRPWFSRLWIIQEVVMARNAIVLYDHTRISAVSQDIGEP